MIILRRATMDNFEIYKDMFQNDGLCWTCFDKKVDCTNKEDKVGNCEDPELKKISDYYQNYRKEYFEEELAKEYMYVYVIYDDESIVGYVNIAYCWSTFEKTSEGKRVKVSRYHIGEFGLQRELTDAKNAEVITRITEIDFPRKYELVIWAATDESKKALLENGFVKTGKDSKPHRTEFLVKRWTLEEVQMQARKKRKRKG